MIRLASGPFHHHDPLGRSLSTLEANAYEAILVGWVVIVAVRGRRLIAGLMFGILGPGASIALGVSSAIVTLLIAQAPNIAHYGMPSLEPSHMFAPSEDPPIASYVIAPIGEELFFQVGLQTRLQRYGAATAIVGTTAAFFAVHIFIQHAPFAEATYMLLPGFFVAALIRQYTKKFVAVVVDHAAFNVLVSSLVYGAR